MLGDLGPLFDYKPGIPLVDRPGAELGFGEPLIDTTSGRGEDMAADGRRSIRRAALIGQAVEILQVAHDRTQLSLGTLCQVHALLVDVPSGIGGTLRDGPAVVRLDGKIHFVPPPAAASRLGTEVFVRILAEHLTAGSKVPAAVFAADSAARFSDLHPFSDGNGRVARTIATWLLLRAGYRVKPGVFLADVCYLHRREYFRTLRNYERDPRAWRQFFFDAVLTCFHLPVCGFKETALFYGNVFLLHLSREPELPALGI
jgi:Fic family protein